MKKLKYTENDIKTLKEKFEEYVAKIKPGDKIKFEYDFKDDTKKVTLKFSKEAYIKMTQLVARTSTEIGWNGSVERVSDTEFYVKDIYVYPQTVSGATVTCDELETAKWYTTLPEEVFKSLRFQGHSHVNMGVTPSSTDETMYKNYLDLLNQEEDYYIFMILNKSGANYIRIIDFKTNNVYYKEDVTLAIEGIEEYIEESMKNVSTHKPQQDTTIITYNNKSSEKIECDKKCSECPRNKKEKCLEEYLERVNRTRYTQQSYLYGNGGLYD